MRIFRRTKKSVSQSKRRKAKIKSALLSFSQVLSAISGLLLLRDSIRAKRRDLNPTPTTKDKSEINFRNGTKYDTLH